MKIQYFDKYPVIFGVSNDNPNISRMNWKRGSLTTYETSDRRGDQNMIEMKTIIKLIFF